MRVHAKLFVTARRIRKQNFRLARKSILEIAETKGEIWTKSIHNRAERVFAHKNWAQGNSVHYRSNA
jgi:hypothetical protein